MHDRQQVGRSRGVQQLGANGDTPRLGEIESMDGHVARIPKAEGAPDESSRAKPKY